VNFNTGKDNETLPAPNLGEHTEETLSKLGYSNSEIKKLVSDGVIKL
jgi:crotonobetainyl-CoA:carnitine CoA-transferase CaiB-like acyl-CoA transferase